MCQCIRMRILNGKIIDEPANLVVFQNPAMSSKWRTSATPPPWPRLDKRRTARHTCRLTMGGQKMKKQRMLGSYAIAVFTTLALCASFTDAHSDETRETISFRVTNSSLLTFCIASSSQDCQNAKQVTCVQNGRVTSDTGSCEAYDNRFACVCAIDLKKITSE